METPSLCSSSRGIQNVSGVACHVSSAIQVVYHAVPDATRQRMTLLSSNLSIASCSSSSSSETILGYRLFLVEWGNFIQEMRCDNVREESGSAVCRTRYVDPTKLYNLLMPSINIAHVGDAGSTMRIILSTLRKSLESLMDEDENLCEDGYGTARLLASTVLAELQEIFWKGTMSHQMIGSRLSLQNGDVDKAIRMKRCKAKKIRPIACPLPIPVRGYTRLVSALQSVISSRQYIADYDWDSLEPHEYVETREPFERDASKDALCMERLDLLNDHAEGHSLSSLSSSSTYADDDATSVSSSESTSSSSAVSCSCWRTYKHLQIQSLPKVLILQLNRSEYVDGRIKILNAAIHIPYELELHTSESFRYHLDGAIVYQDHNNETMESELERHGHYIGYFKEHNSSEEEQEFWKKVNDEKVTLFLVADDISKQKVVVSRKALCSLLGGKTRNKKFFATLIMYKLVE